MKKEKFCTHCHLIHDANEVKRSYGKESAVYLGGFHSAGCYTKHLMKMEKIIPIEWTRASIMNGKLPEMSKRKNSNECSDLVLVFCKDGEIRTGRYYKKERKWLIYGICGQPLDFVRYWAVNISDETEKMKARMIQDEKFDKEAADFCALGSNITDV